MKKLIIAAFAVAFAAVAQAAAINWTAAGVASSPDVALTAANQYTAYFFATLDTSSQLTTTTIEDVVAAITSGSDFTSLASYSKGNTYAAASQTGSFSSLNNGSFAAGTQVSGFVVIVDDSANVKNYMIAQDASGNQVLTKTAASSGNMVFGFGNQGTSGAEWVAVPEPTSGLLLLIGMAGLALKRKQA